MKLLKETFSILLATSLIATPLLSVNATELSHSDLPEYYSSSFLEDCKYNRSDEYLRVEYQYYDALRVLENPQNYHPTVINFKAHCLNNNLKALFPNIL